MNLPWDPGGTPSLQARRFVLASSKLATQVRSQAAHYIDTTLSRALLIKHLKVFQ